MRGAFSFKNFGFSISGTVGLHENDTPNIANRWRSSKAVCCRWGCYNFESVISGRSPIPRASAAARIHLARVMASAQGLPSPAPNPQTDGYVVTISGDQNTKNWSRLFNFSTSSLPNEQRPPAKQPKGPGPPFPHCLSCNWCLGIC